MNELTIHGNVTADPVLSHGRNGSGTAFTSFSVAVNRSYFDRARNARVEQPAVFHRVVVFNDLAENTAATVRKGMTVTVTGQLADDSYTPDGSDRIIRRHRLEASDVAVSLRWATAAVTRRTRGGQNLTPTEPGGPAADSSHAADAPEAATA